MNIQSISGNQQSFGNGLYFYTKRLSDTTIWWAKRYNNAVSRISEQGREYLPDLKISDELKQRVAKIPFIENLSRNQDTFVNITTLENTGKYAKKFDKFEASASIVWKDSIDHARYAVASSNNSVKEAIDNLLEKITNENFIVSNLM